MTGPEKASFWLRELYNGVNLYSRFTEIKVVIYMYTSGYTWNSGELSYLSILFYMWECLRVSNPFLKRGNIQLKCVNVQLFKLIVSSSLFEEREVSLFMKYHNWLSYCIKDRKSDKWKIPRCSYTFKLLEYTWTFPVTDLHFPPCDVVSGFWQWVSDTLGKLQGQGGGQNLPLPNVINHAYSQSIIFSLDVWGHRSTVYWETISDHGPNTNKTMIFALEILLLSGKLSMLDYLEVSYAKYSVFDMGLGWQYQKKVNILLYFW